MSTDNSALDRLRRQIDALDDRLHDLLMERTALAEQIGAAKPAGDQVALRPGREAAIVRRLLARHQGAFPKPALVRIWRELMGALVGLQRPFSVAVFQPERGAGYIELARNHFGSVAPMNVHPSPGHVVREVADGIVAVGVVPLPRETDAEPWWLSLTTEAENLPRVVARLPVLAPEFVPGKPEPLEALVLCLREHDETGDDRTLVSVETVPDLSRDRLRGLLTAAGLEPVSMMSTWRSDHAWLHLVEAAGHVTQGDERLSALLGKRDAVHHVRIIGGYPAPISV